MPGALLTQQSVDGFRRWLAAAPRGVFEKRVTGACDASLENGNGGGAPTPPRYYNREAARRLLQFLATKLKPADLAEAWRMIEARLEAKFGPNEQPRRGNGVAHAHRSGHAA